MVSLSCGRLFYRLLDNLQSFEKTIIKKYLFVFALCELFGDTLCTNQKRSDK